MKLTRKSLKNLISETIREQNSLLLEMPEGRDEQNDFICPKKLNSCMIC